MFIRKSEYERLQDEFASYVMMYKDQRDLVLKSHERIEELESAAAFAITHLRSTDEQD